MFLLEKLKSVQKKNIQRHCQNVTRKFKKDSTVKYFYRNSEKTDTKSNC